MQRFPGVTRDANHGQLLPGLLRRQHLWLGEEVETLLQSEVSRSGRLAQRARVLLVLELLGAHQDVLLEPLVVLPHQLQGGVLRELIQQLLCGREERRISIIVIIIRR